MQNRDWSDSVTALSQARLQATPLDDLPAQQTPQSLEEAYALQKALNKSLATTILGRPVGYKIGCTTKVMQEYLGIPHPCAGTLFNSSIQRTRGTYKRSDYCNPGVECEIAVVIGRDITDRDDLSQQTLADSIVGICDSIELVDSRWRDFSRVSTPLLVAENFFNAGCVLSTPRAVDPNTMEQLVGTLIINDETIGSGSGRDILGHPLAALGWLAGHQIEQGIPIRENDVVTLGSVVKSVWIDAGDEVRVILSDVGEVSLLLE